jgi:hypothetical protein
MIKKAIKAEVNSKSEKSWSDIKTRSHLFGHFKGKAFSEMKEFRKYLTHLSQTYGVNLKCLESWRQEFEDSVDRVWLLFTGLLLEKLKESNDCLSRRPIMVLKERDSSLSGVDGVDVVDGANNPVVQWSDALKVNKVSSIYRYSQSSSICNPRRISRKGYNPGKSVPRVNFSGRWLENYGFEKGKRYAVYGFKNHLVLKSVEDSGIPIRIGGRMVKDSSITIGRTNS